MTTINTNSSNQQPSTIWRIVSEYGFLIVFITIAWLATWEIKGSLANIATEPLPNWFFGDMPFTFAWIKAYIDHGLIDPFVNINQFLNAPYVANWNDFPGEDLTFYLNGQFAKVFGIFLGPNLYFLTMQVLSGVLFYFVSTSFQYRHCWSMMCAIAFAFAPLIFYRGFGHPSIASIWYLPLMIFTFVWVNHPDKVSLSYKNSWRICIATAVIAGLTNIYYTALFTLILGANWLTRLIRKDRSSQQIALLIMLIFVAEFVQHFNHFLFIWQEGRNHLAMIRDLGTFLLVGLTIPDMFLSPAHNASLLNAVPAFAKNYYNFFPAQLTTESRLSFIGTTAACGLVILFVQSTLRIFEKRWDQINHWFWLALGILAFSITGGLNFVLGAFGYLFIRSNNRYSVFLMLIGLYFLCELLSKKPGRPYHWIIATIIAVMAILDQVPTQESSLKYALGAQTLPDIHTTKKFVQELEANLPPSAMIFQLPVHPFPEMGTKEKMGDYEEFMPYLFSHSLRFSYGSNKGRDDTRWQIALETLPTKEALLKLEQYGFSAVLIHKKAYADNAKGLTEIIKQLHYEMIGESPSLIAFRLHPSATPISPAPAWQLVNSGELELVDPETAYQWKMPRDQYALTIKRPWYLRLDPKSPYSTNSPLALDFISSKNCSVWYQFNNHEMLELRISAGKAAKAIVLPNAKQDNTLLLKHDCASNNAGSTTPIKNSDAPLVMRQMMN